MRQKRLGYPTVKRVGDIVVSLGGLLVTAPLLAGTAIAVRSTLGQPVLFLQERPGRDEKIFRIVKFRTMLQPDPADGLVDDASRMTSFGRFLRSTSIDELPTLWNVLRGDMSLVGPRPLLPEYLHLYSPRQASRHEVRPGVTGLAQVSGRNELDWNDRLELDAQYVENCSLLLDLGILVQTLRTVLRRHGIAAKGHVSMVRFEGTHPQPSTRE